MAGPIDALGLPRHPTRSPVGAHGIPRGRPWASMAEHVGFRGRPSKVPWDPTGVAVHLNMGSHVSCHGLPCDIPLGSAWPPMWHKKKQENRTQGVRGNKVACSYVVVGDDLGRFSAVSYTHLTLPTNREV